MKGYFFIPATRLHKLPEIVKSGVDEIVIDLEDAVLIEDRRKLIDQLKLVDDQVKSLWIRVPLRDDWEEEVDVSMMVELLESGWANIAIPKVKNIDEFKAVSAILESTRLLKRAMLLVEHPRLLIDLREVFLLNSGGIIESIAFGAHDFVNHMGGEFSFERLLPARMQCLYVARAFGIKALDIASVNISDEHAFIAEVADGLNTGFDGKFLIHPVQWPWMQTALDQTQRELIWARKVMNALPSNTSGKEIEPFVLEGEIIEKPHVERAMNILKRK